jgi:hypothetical protein
MNRMTVAQKKASFEGPMEPSKGTSIAGKVHVHVYKDGCFINIETFT